MESSETCLKYIKERLFYAKTGLFYDTVIEENTPVPCAFDVANDIPTANGNGTVMEDCIISGGTCLDGLCDYMLQTNGKEADFAEKVAEGMLCCAECGKDGFLPRGVSPVDGRLHYRDCSRDQITMFLYGLLRYYHSGYCPDRLKIRIEKASEAVAERAIRNVTAENGWNMLTEDLMPSVNGTMWGEKCKAHEMFRLPQIFLTAYVLSGNKKYYERYMSVRDEAIKSSMNVEPCWAMYCLQQMAVSIDTARRFDEDIAAVCTDILKKIASVAREKIPEIKQNIVSIPDADFAKRDYYVNFYHIQDAAIVLMLQRLSDGERADGESVALCTETLNRIPLDGKTALPIHFFTALVGERR